MSKSDEDDSLKKTKLFMLLCILAVSSILAFTGCGRSLRMDTDKCAEVALEYLEDKYDTEFELDYSNEPVTFAGLSGYAKVVVKKTFEDKEGKEDKERKFLVTVYPESISDADEDGYYDSYKVVSDDYMCHFVADCAKSDLDKLLMDAGLTRFITNLGIHEKGTGDFGFSADFPLPDEKNFSLTDIWENYAICIDCTIEVPESDYSDKFQENITDILKDLITSDDLVTFDVVIYFDENYSEIEELNENHIGYTIKGDKRIYFSVKKEE